MAMDIKTGGIIKKRTSVKWKLIIHKEIKLPKREMICLMKTS